MKLIKLLATLLLLASTAFAEPGLDYLAGSRYRDQIVAEHPVGWAAGFFLKTFGDARPSIRSLAATGKAPRIRVHIVWEDDHTYIASKHDPIILEGIRQLNEIKKEFPNIDIQASPFCEHNIELPALTKLFAKIRKEAKGLTLVNTPFKGALLPGILNEVHGDHAPLEGPYNYSFDGDSVEDLNVTEFKIRHARAQTIFYWSRRFNLHWNEHEKLPRDQRTGFPSNRFIRSIAFLHTDRGDIKVSRGYIIKSHAERFGASDLRGDKLVIIAPIYAKTLVLKANDGVTLATLTNRGSYQKGGWRYYSTRFGYEIAKKALRYQGSANVKMFLNGKSVGIINPAFRAGTYRN